MINLSETVTLVEVIWVFVAIVAMTNHLTLLFHALEDNNIAKKKSKDKAVLYTASEAVTQQLIRMLAQGCFLVAGLLATMLPSAGYILDDDRLILLGSITQGLIIIGQIFLMVAAIKLHFERHKLLALIGGRRASDLNELD